MLMNEEMLAMVHMAAVGEVGGQLAVDDRDASVRAGAIFHPEWTGKSVGALVNALGRYPTDDELATARGHYESTARALTSGMEPRISKEDLLYIVPSTSGGG